MPLPRINYDLVLYYTRRFAESNMRSTVSVLRKPEPVYDPASGRVASADPEVIYSGVARIAPVTGPLSYVLGDESQQFQQAMVSIPAVTDDLPAVKDLVVVSAHPGDPTVVGRVFQVLDVEAGGQWLASRRLQVVGVQEAPYWSRLVKMVTAAASAAAGGGVTDLVAS